MSDHRRSDSLLRGLIWGALIGAGLVYYLTSTKEGRKTSKRLKEKGEEALAGLGEIVSDLEEKSEDFRQRAKEIQADLEEKAQDVREEVVQEAREQLTRLQKIRNQGDAVSKKFFTKGGKSLAKKP